MLFFDKFFNESFDSYKAQISCIFRMASRYMRAVIKSIENMAISHKMEEGGGA